MDLMSYLYSPWGILIQVLAIFHFIRRKPDGYWLWIILFFGRIGAIIYLLAEALPDARLSFRGFSRRNRIGQLQAELRDNPSCGNYEELGDLYLEGGKLALAREAYELSIAARASTIDPFYHRGVCALLLGDAVAALPDLERTVREAPGHDFQRAQGLLAHAYAQTGQPEMAEAQFREALTRSTLSETYLNYANFLAAQGRAAEARVWTSKVLEKRNSLLRYQRRRERPNFRRAQKLMKSLPA
jgi:hypothetical protein